MTKGVQIRRILERPGILVLPGVYDCVGSRLVEQLGFDVVFTSGFGISGSSLGLPDYGFLSGSEVLSVAGKIIASTSLPVVVDIDTGYGNPLNVLRTVREIVRLGAGGIILEDQHWPKKCGHFAGKRVISRAEHIEKIHAAVEARGDSGLLIIGRTDARAALGLDEAISRGRAYFEAGADVVFVEAPESREELQVIASSFPGVPLFANMIEGGRTPVLTARDLEELGFKIVVFPLSALFAATRAMAACLSYLKEHGTTGGYEDLMVFEEFERIIGVPAYRELEARYSVKEKVR